MLAERTPCITIDSFENFHDLWVERGSLAILGAG